MPWWWGGFHYRFAVLACFQWFVWVSIAGGFGFVHGGADDLCFGFYFGIGLEFQFGCWVLFGFEMVAMAMGGEIGLPTVI